MMFSLSNWYVEMSERDMIHLRRENNPRRQSAVTFSCLGKLQSVGRLDLLRWERFMEKLVDAERCRNLSSRPLVIGLAESGIVPSAIIHRILRKNKIYAGWACSTRRQSTGVRFSESHSHSPNHTLPLPDFQPTELWFVEDEITTGRTVLKLAMKLCWMLNVRQVRFFAIADSRNSRQRRLFHSVLTKEHIEYSLHILIQNEKQLDEDEADSHLFSEAEQDDPAEMTEGTLESDWHFPSQRPALKNQLDVKLPLPRNLEGSLLVIGEAVDMALKLVQSNPKLFFHHITLSPWQIDGRHIVTRLMIGGRYYLYNYHKITPPFYVLSDPVDRHVEKDITEQFAAKGIHLRQVLSWTH